MLLHVDAGYNHFTRFLKDWVTLQLGNSHVVNYFKLPVHQFSGLLLQVCKFHTPEMWLWMCLNYILVPFLSLKGCLPTGQKIVMLMSMMFFFLTYVLWLWTWRTVKCVSVHLAVCLPTGWKIVMHMSMMFFLTYVLWLWTWRTVKCESVYFLSH